MRNLPHLIGVGALLVMALAGCGDADSTDSGPGAATDPTSTESDTPTTSVPDEETTAASDLPSCTEVWVAGSSLPSSYRGCFDGSADVKAEKTRCSSGQTLVTYDDTFWAVTGAEIHETTGLTGDSGFEDVKQSCLA